MPIASIDYPKAAIMRAGGLTYAEIAGQLGVNAHSLRVGMSRKGLATVSARTRKHVIAKAEDTADAVLNGSKSSRVTIAKALADDVSYLEAAKPVKNDDEACAKYTKLAPLLAACERVYGWRADDQPAAALSFSRLDLHVHSDQAGQAVAEHSASTPSASTYDAQGTVLDCQTVVSDTPASQSTSPLAQVDASPSPATTS